MIRFGRRWVIAATVISCCLAILMTWQQYRSAQDTATEAVANLAECERLTQELDRIRDAPRVASLEAEPPDRIAARVTAAATNALLPPLSIYSVDPQMPSRLAQSAYQLRATQIVVQHVTLKQLAGFILGLEDHESGLVVRDVSLSASDRVADDSELWNARLTLTQMIYSPISDR